MNDKVLNLIESAELLSSEDYLVVGFSGGADSVALLHFLHTISKSWNLRLLPCHINHNIRGDEALRDENFCRDFCKELSLDIAIFSVDVPKLACEQKKSTELMAREVRYQCFSKLCKENNAKLATAHTLSDSMETVIFNLSRGTGLTGLTGIPVEREFDGGIIIRPFSTVTRQEIEQYCMNNSLKYITDSTNFSNDYKRNYIRQEIVPKLFNLNENFPAVFGRTLEILQNDSIYLEDKAKNIYLNLKTADGIPCSELTILEPAIFSRVVIYLLKDCLNKKISIDYKKLKLIEKLIMSNLDGQIQITKGIYLSVMSSILSVKRYAQQVEYFEYPIEIGQMVATDFGKTVLIAPLNCKYSVNFEKSTDFLLKNSFDCDKIVGNIIVRQRKTGDRYTLYNKVASRELKKLFNDFKIPSGQRDKLLILTDESGIIWAEKLGVAKRVMPDSTTVKDSRTIIVIS